MTNEKKQKIIDAVVFKKKRCLVAGVLAFVMILSGCGSRSTTTETESTVSGETESVEENVSSETVSIEETVSSETVSIEETVSSETESVEETVFSETASAEENEDNEMKVSETDSSKVDEASKVESKTNTITKAEDTNSSEPNKESDITFETVNVGDKITTNDVEMTITQAVENKKIENPNATGYYTMYLDAGDKDTFIYFTGTIKNIGTSAISTDEMRIDVLIDDKYEYYGHITAQDHDDGDISSLATYLKPFESTVYYIYVSVPDELITNYKTCKFNFGFKEGFTRYSSVFDDWADCDYRYTINIQK